jgi:hypothetical protein
MLIGEPPFLLEQWLAEALMLAASGHGSTLAPFSLAGATASDTEAT